MFTKKGIIYLKAETAVTLLVVVLIVIEFIRACN
jgi:hypothetical protein